MAACSSKDRDSGVSSFTAASSTENSSTTNIKLKTKSSLSKSQCGKKDPKNKESEISLESLPESALEALLKEAVNYRGPKDSQSGTELFQNLLRETSDSRDDSPPAFHYPVAPQRRRRSRKESGGVHSAPHPGHTSSVAGSSRRGGSLQNISANNQGDFASRRGRKRHDTSGGGATPLSPRKREGGSLPCDVARGSKTASVMEETCQAGRKDTVIDMDGVVDVYSADVSRIHTESSDTSHTDIDKQNSSSYTGLEDMEVDSETKPKFSDETKRIYNSNLEMTDYGAVKITSAVDSPVLFSSLQQNATVVTSNGSPEENVGSSLRRLPTKRTNSQDPNDINGNPLTNGPSPFSPSTFSTLMCNGGILYPHGHSLSYNSAHGSNSNQNSALFARAKAKRAKAKEESGIVSDMLPGFRGNEDVSVLLEYIESSDSNGKKSVDLKKSSVKSNNGSLPGKLVKSKERKSSKPQSAADTFQQPDYDAQDSDNADSSPGAPDPQTPVRKKEQESSDLPELEDTEFQTVTKKQRRKKRLVNGSSSPSSRRQQHRRSAGAAGSVPGSKMVASVPPSEHSDVEDSDGGDSVHSLPVQHSAPLFPRDVPVNRDRRSDFPPLQGASSAAESATTPLSLPPPVKSAPDFGFPPLSEDDPCTHFLSDTSSIYPTSYADIARLVRSSATVDLSAPLNHLPIESGATATTVPSARSTGSILKRPAPSFPAADTPAVVIVGQPSAVDVDITFGFELNEQLLRLTLTSNQEVTQVKEIVDFSAKYRETPETNNKFVAQNCKEVIGFISEAWRRIERKLQEQPEQQQKPVVRVYTVD